ncbi:FAD binding domain-containing protein [Rhizobium leguminosarum]|uniref:FAD binding domain-containing protein n=1 Tax=Rhizobium leguminosarum TaxID=384 RepID=UPI00098E88AE|nr:FAD binding domain-containing protein [Rhizobium leguminosarum]ASS58060.1 carbon monoxide dehydrogenase [Rhizobium leguminosarum bv. viciae]MBB4329989.1 carbon-monoxide dehydrogenase medium subunit [Rhizobium leguminosarum]MBB4355384.1 carbon-monoxide dehydrogenase medium subunit [Rhizobium leguminosarum]MBB4389993.1 carbon-monoxide dehydrogenase medium subunit [Rhizobium leguminosarum]MBB4550492.1 carbon-monoxide dehydrogenase medium subunit [Rhizobium leguminosarum]
MKPAQFDYIAPTTIDAVAAALAAAEGDGKIIAGGQSLMPMINFRLVKPTILIDINRVAGLDRIELHNDRVKIGATVRHHMTATDAIIRAHLPIVHEAMHHVAHMTVRNRGTFCGSVAHADPATEMPMMTRFLDGTIIAYSVRGRREIPAADFFVGSLVNSMEPDEFVVGVELDAMRPDAGWGFEEFARRHGDFALACFGTTLRCVGGRASDVRVGMMGVGETPLRLEEIEHIVEGTDVSEPVLDKVVDRLAAILTPNTDIHASADYRRHLSGVLAKRAIRAAWSRANHERH